MFVEYLDHSKGQSSLRYDYEIFDYHFIDVEAVDVLFSVIDQDPDIVNLFDNQ